MNESIQVMLERFQSKSSQDYENALQMVIQEIILLGLDRSSFFEKGALRGGSALRIFHGLDRLSENLDFTLLKSNRGFKFDRYLSSLERELKAFNFELKVIQGGGGDASRVESSFFLEISPSRRLESPARIVKNLKIKIELDLEPSKAFDTEIQTLLLPSPYTVKVLTPSSLFAEKMYAALFRKWKDRVKGRDFYDVQWYISRGIPLGMSYLESKMRDSKLLPRGSLTREKLITLFLSKIEELDWGQAIQDVLPFVREQGQVKLWSPKFFKQIIERIQLQE